MHDISKLKSIASQVRRDIVRMVHACQSGHPGGSLGCTDFLVALYFDAMKRKEGFDMTGKAKMFFIFPTVIFPQFFTVFWHTQDISINLNWPLSES